MKKGPGSVYDKWNISVVYGDTDIPYWKVSGHVFVCYGYQFLPLFLWLLDWILELWYFLFFILFELYIISSELCFLFFVTLDYSKYAFNTFTASITLLVDCVIRQVVSASELTWFIEDISKTHISMSEMYIS